jgi:hypothetical protein
MHFGASGESTGLQNNICRDDVCRKR